ncbi:MAG TPA: hypothetical protein VIF62_06300 [Labilithrix sp.]
MAVVALVGCGGAVAVEKSSGAIANDGDADAPSMPPSRESDATPAGDASQDRGASDASTGCDVQVIPQDGGCQPHTTPIDPALCGLAPVDTDPGKRAADDFCSRLLDAGAFGDYGVNTSLPQADGTFVCSFCM